jgi:F-type H+-transporting ATPase subunit epsilon
MGNANSNEPIRLIVLTPSRKVMDVECRDVSFPSSLGRLQILPDHAELVCQIGTGVIYFNSRNTTGFCAVAGGIAEIGRNKVTLLADVAEDSTQIDVTRAQKALDRAKGRLSGREAVDQQRASLAEEKARARLEAAQQGRSRA